MGARDRIAYIRGLLDAGGVPEGIASTLCGAVVEALEALAAENEELKKRLDEQQSAIDDLNFVCEELDADLADVEACRDVGGMNWKASTARRSVLRAGCISSVTSRF